MKSRPCTATNGYIEAQIWDHKQRPWWCLWIKSLLYSFSPEWPLPSSRARMSSRPKQWPRAMNGAMVQPQFWPVLVSVTSSTSRSFRNYVRQNQRAILIQSCPSLPCRSWPYLLQPTTAREMAPALRREDTYPSPQVRMNLP